MTDDENPMTKEGRSPIDVGCGGAAANWVWTLVNGGFCNAFACCAKSWATGSGASGCGWGVYGLRLERKVAPVIGGMAHNSLW